MIKRESYMSRIRPFFGTDLIKVITGIRRCGKSTMLELIKKELVQTGIDPAQFISFDFEKIRYSPLLTAQALHQEIIKRAEEIGGKVYLFLDEVQEVKDWGKCLRSLRVSLDCDIYITLSNAKPGEVAASLPGHYVQFVVYPFSFAEFMELYKPEAPNESVRECFQKYLLYGGMPFLANVRYEDQASKQYLQDLLLSIQFTDVFRSNNIRNPVLLQRVILYAIENAGKVFSASFLAKLLKNEHRSVAPETIRDYLKYCREAYLFYQVKREDLREKQILSSNEKYYIADHAILEAVFEEKKKDINLILENIVYLELIRRGFKVTTGRIERKEIDFVCRKGGEKLYVQVAYILATQEVVAREFGAFEGIRDNFPRYVVSMDEIDMSQNGIKHCNIWEFLLMEEWN